MCSGVDRKPLEGQMVVTLGKAKVTGLKILGRVDTPFFLTLV